MCEFMQDGRDWQQIAPAMQQYIIEIKLYGKAILRKHTEKHTRKDIYVEAHSE